ncbi:MAG: PIG-L family deacetylase [Verrucomicrobiota bacterium]
MPTAFAIFSHPDDIEFLAAGTLRLLQKAGWDTHYMSLSSGDCGSHTFGPQQTSEIRVKEAMTAAQILGAQFHGSPEKDLQLVYNVDSVRRLAATIREVRPDIILTHSPEDYMEDHTGTSRLVVTAAFARNMPNFGTHPPSEAVDFSTIVYHAMPHGLRDSMRRKVFAEIYIDTSSVHEEKRQALGAHASQRAWLAQTQGMDNYLETLDLFSEEVGRMSGKFTHAEGWRRHSHLGFHPQDDDPLSRTLPQLHWINPAYAGALERGTYPDQ